MDSIMVALLVGYVFWGLIMAVITGVCWFMIFVIIGKTISNYCEESEKNFNARQDVKEINAYADMHNAIWRKEHRSDK